MRPQTAAEQRRQKLLVKKAKIADRKKAALIKMHEVEEAKIAALNAKLERSTDLETNAARVKEFAERLRVKANQRP